MGSRGNAPAGVRGQRVRGDQCRQRDSMYTACSIVEELRGELVFTISTASGSERGQHD